jgi:hypothetical protein
MLGQDKVLNLAVFTPDPPRAALLVLEFPSLALIRLRDGVVDRPEGGEREAAVREAMGVAVASHVMTT